MMPLLLCSHSPNDVPTEPQRNVSIAAVRGAERPSKYDAIKWNRNCYTNSVGAIKETEYKTYFRTDFDLKKWRLIKENILLIDQQGIRSPNWFN